MSERTVKRPVALEGDTYPLRAVPGYYASRRGVQIGTQLPPDAPDEELRFARQLGIEWVMTSLPPEQHSVDSYLRLRERFERCGLKIYRLANHDCHNMPEVTLNLPGREAKIAQYLDYIRMLGRAGIRYATYAHMANGIWSTGRGTVRGGAEGRAFDLSRADKGYWIDRTYEGPLTHGRRYSEEELWDNYAHFIRQVAPVAEEAGVRIGIHPDDPPIHPLGGIPRCIFGSFEGYRRALEIADSPNIGMCLCVGCWLEGGEGMGRDVVGTIRHFGGQGKLWKVYLRNVSAPMPQPWVETFLDDGYMDMDRVMRALREVAFDGCVISDHLPQTAGGRRATEAWSLGYMRGLLQAANNAFGGPE